MNDNHHLTIVPIVPDARAQPVLPRSPSPRGKNKSMSMGFGQIIPNT